MVPKRTHALLDLLSSERGYAWDLELIQKICIPLATEPLDRHQIEETSTFHTSTSLVTLVEGIPAPPDQSFGEESDPPMTRENVQFVFNNIADLAAFADHFTEEIERALGDIMEGGEGEDRVGRLFLNAIPTMKTLYFTYIVKLPDALECLQNLPRTEILLRYLSVTSSLLSGDSSMGNLSVWLHKPIQRLLKYPVILSAIIEETPKTHKDRENLVQARNKVIELVRTISVEQDRRGIVKRLLTEATSGLQKPRSRNLTVNRRGMNLATAAAVSLGRLRRMRAGSSSSQSDEGADEEAAQVKRFSEELHKLDQFMRDFAIRAVEWTNSVHKLMQELQAWALSLERVIWMDDGPESEIYVAFLEIINSNIPSICDLLIREVRVLLNQLCRLSVSAAAPSRLLEVMRTLAPLHYSCLGLKGWTFRPPPQLLDSSRSYVALRTQLATELPQYLQILNKGALFAIQHFMRSQRSFYDQTGAIWCHFWKDGIAREDDLPLGMPHLVDGWSTRWNQADNALRQLRIVHPPADVPTAIGTNSPIEQHESAAGTERRMGITSFYSDTTTLVDRNATND
ncbi:Dbl homology domain-containing protein [Obba rivulosa]|uniref:Dbl homology domain-containing protein n=1 Tax=Obba rivulosa TaxID=1052685 RepID=A0A8E2DLY6_9APHY|nr:Dbl homology domain-containing protein [Obba rivulosa]